VGKPDEKVGEEPIAYIQPKKKGTKVTEKEIMAHTNS
jgi:hypothetical protein